MTDFAAIDFETANGQRSSVCSVGVVVVRNGLIINTFYSLIKPEPDYYAWFCQKVHGLTHEDTDNAPVFPDVWRQIILLPSSLSYAEKAMGTYYVWN
jgi:DNA polymerase-3 subunit epsilon